MCAFIPLRLLFVASKGEGRRRHRDPTCGMQDTGTGRWTGTGLSGVLLTFTTDGVPGIIVAHTNLIAYEAAKKAIAPILLLLRSPDSRHAPPSVLFVRFVCTPSPPPSLAPSLTPSLAYTHHPFCHPRLRSVVG